MKSTRQRISRAAFPLLLSGGLLVSASDDTKTKATDAAAQGRETVAKPLTEKEKKKKEAKLRKELETPYKKWLNEDVAYIITDEERTGVQAPATPTKSASSSSSSSGCAAIPLPTP